MPLAWVAHLAMTTAVITVQLFESLTEDSDIEFFAKGFRDDLVTELSRFSELAVVTPETGLHDSGDLRYTLQGSIRRGEDRLRVTAQLVDASTGEHRWAEKFESHDSDPLSLQDEIACAVAGTLASHIAGLATRQARRTPVTNLAAYECWLRGRECLEQGTPAADLEARGYFERALELDPNYPRAYAGISLSYYNDWSCQSWHLWREGEQLAGEYAEKAVAHDGGDAITHVVLGRVRLYQRKFGQAEQCLERALNLNPNDKEVLSHVALWTFYLGKPDEALDMVERAMALDPGHGLWLHGVRGLALYNLRRYADAERSLAKAATAFVDFPAMAAAAAAMHGDTAAAQTHLDSFLTSFKTKITFGREPSPGEAVRWLMDVNPLRREADLEHILEGWRTRGTLRRRQRRGPQRGAPGELGPRRQPLRAQRSAVDHRL